MKYNKILFTSRDIPKRVASILLLLFLFLTVLLIAGGCEGRNEKIYELQYNYDRNLEYFPEKKWSKLASPQLAGWSIAKLEQARQFSEDIHSGSVVIVENGVIIAEWGSTASRYKLHSMRKSLMSAMYGIHVARHEISLKSTLQDLKITDIGGLSKKEQQATVYDLITARSGIYHAAAYETDGMRMKRPARYSSDPGTRWYYNNWDFNALLTIFNQQTKKDFFEQFQQEIATPLQMEHFRMQDMNYRYEMNFSSHPAYLFKMSTLDLARFGLLYLRQGRWRDQQIIPAEWVQESTKKHMVFKPKNPEKGYGYLWWINKDIYYASGNGGQALFILPNSNLVIVHCVDTDKGVRVKSDQTWRLFNKILQAREM